MRTACNICGDRDVTCICVDLRASTPVASAAGSSKLVLRKSADILITDADRNLALGSGELLPCPFCGTKAASAGEQLPNGRFRWRVTCQGPHDPGISTLWNNCAASTWGVGETQDEARSMAVTRWNRRHNAQRSEALPPPLAALPPP